MKPERIRELRIGAGLSQAQLARKMRVSSPHIVSAWEIGARNISNSNAELLRRICKEAGEQTCG